jgi:hypothetical protein
MRNPAEGVALNQKIKTTFRPVKQGMPALPRLVDSVVACSCGQWSSQKIGGILH